jgi:hypothetical protein
VLTGSLVSGRTYSLSVYAVIGTYLGQYQFTSSTGQFKIAFVPEPVQLSSCWADCSRSPHFDDEGRLTPESADRIGLKPPGI